MNILKTWLQKRRRKSQIQALHTCLTFLLNRLIEASDISTFHLSITALQTWLAKFLMIMFSWSVRDKKIGRCSNIRFNWSRSNKNYLLSNWQSALGVARACSNLKTFNPWNRTWISSPVRTITHISSYKQNNYIKVVIALWYGELGILSYLWNQPIRDLLT